MLSSTLIYMNKKQEEVARVTFDDSDVPGWCIKSKGKPGLEVTGGKKKEESKKGKQ